MIGILIFIVHESIILLYIWIYVDARSQLWIIIVQFNIYNIKTFIYKISFVLIDDNPKNPV